MFLCQPWSSVTFNFSLKARNLVWESFLSEPGIRSTGYYEGKSQQLYCRLGNVTSNENCLTHWCRKIWLFHFLKLPVWRSQDMNKYMHIHIPEIIWLEGKKRHLFMAFNLWDSTDRAPFIDSNKFLITAAVKNESVTSLLNCRLGVPFKKSHLNTIEERSSFLR